MLVRTFFQNTSRFFSNSKQWAEEWPLFWWYMQYKFVLAPSYLLSNKNSYLLSLIQSFKTVFFLIYFERSTIFLFYIYTILGRNLHGSCNAVWSRTTQYIFTKLCTIEQSCYINNYQQYDCNWQISHSNFLNALSFRR